MTADVNVTEKVARAEAERRYASPAHYGRAEIQAFIAGALWHRARGADFGPALADPEVLAGIAGVLREHDIDKQVDGRPYCWTCHTADPVHVAAAVVEWLRGERA